jgi:LmbE family N-acetylglucosaminyl deacetylase
MMAGVKHRQASGLRPTVVSAGRGVLRRMTHAVVFPAVEACNAGLFRMAGLLLRMRPVRLVPSGSDRVLVLAPHPDDETLGCGGTICRHVISGDQVCIVIVTDGGKSRAGGLNRETMIEMRREEARDAMSALLDSTSNALGTHGAGGLRLVQLGLPEGEWNEQELAQHLGKLLEEFRPTIVYSTLRVDFHPEHLRVAAGFAKALSSSAGTYVERVRAYELQVPLTPMLANLISPVETTQQCKQEALAAYRTQSGSFLWVPRHNRYLRALYRSEGALELFWEMGPRQFVALHANEGIAVVHNFRSIRLRPFTDLAAWMVGIGKRRALRRLVDRNASP